MEARYLGHAGFQVTNNSGNSLVMDPWLSHRGAFLRSWFQFPENHFLADEVQRMDPESAMLYISHHHRDHFDPVFLAGVDKGVLLLVPNFVRRRFVEELRSLGFWNIHEARSGETIEHLGFRLTLFIDENYSNEDSGILVEADGTKFLNMNDCRAYETIDFEILAPLDLFTVQFSGASWFPDVYEYDIAHRNAEAKGKVQRKFENVRRLVKRAHPKLYIPSAGPACFLDEPLFGANFGEPTSFPDASAFLPLLVETGVQAAYIFPGDRITLDASAAPQVQAAAHYTEMLYQERRAYLKDYARRFKSEAALPPATEDQFDRLVVELRRKVQALPQPLQISHRLCVRLTGRPAQSDGDILIDLTARTLKALGLGDDAIPDENLYRFTLTNQVVEQFFATGASWDELMLSLRFNAYRNPDTFESQLADFMRLEASDLEAYPRPTRRERVRVETGGQAYEVDRFCPHQGGDLAQGVIIDGCLVCPRHGWVYDLVDGGRCLNIDATINAVPLEAEHLSGAKPSSAGPA